MKSSYSKRYYFRVKITQTVNKNETSYNGFLRQYFLQLFIIIILLIVILTLSRSLMFMIFCRRVSANLHDTMVDSILQTNIKFFKNNPSGRILNRFTKDMGAIDETLPQVLLNTLQVSFTMVIVAYFQKQFQVGLNVIGVILVVIFVNQWFIIPTALIVTIFYTIRYIYINSSRDIKRIEGTSKRRKVLQDFTNNFNRNLFITAKSLVFHHLITSLNGLSTIRAYQVEKTLKQEFDDQQNRHNSAYYNFLACNATFGFWLDMLSVGYVAVVTFSFLLFEQGNSRFDVLLSY